MCGIVGIVSEENSVEQLIEGLKKLAYRGYDSAGLATLVKGDIVKRGQIIGSVAPGKDFLHFEMIKDNQRVDPIQFFE